MTEPPTGDDNTDAARQARVAALAVGRGTKRRHPAHGARIAAAGLCTTTLLGLVGVMGYHAQSTAPAAAAPTSTRDAQPQVVIVVHPAADSDTVAAAHPGAASTSLTARPTVRPATPRVRAPAATTRGSS